MKNERLKRKRVLVGNQYTYPPSVDNVKTDYLISKSYPSRLFFVCRMDRQFDCSRICSHFFDRLFPTKSLYLKPSFSVPKYKAKPISSHFLLTP